MGPPLVGGARGERAAWHGGFFRACMCSTPHHPTCSSWSVARRCHRPTRPAGAIGTFSSKGTTHGVALVSVPLLKSVSDCDLETVGSPCLLCEVRTARTGVLIRLNSTHVGCSHTHSCCS